MTVHPGLAALAIRRAVPTRILVLAAAVLVFAVTRDWGLSATVPDEERRALAERAFARQGVWLLATLVLIPILVVRAAGFAPGPWAGGHALLRPLEGRALRPNRASVRRA